MNKTVQLNALFEQWKKDMSLETGGFVADGIIDEQLFSQANKKILFITKEPNKPNQEAGDFREWWQQRLEGGFSLRIAEWAHGLLNDFPVFDNINEEQRQQAIRSIAFMNLKKVGGGGTAVGSSIIEHVRNYRHYLLQEIDIIQPDIIITGISGKPLREELFGKLNWKASGYGIEIAQFKHAKLIDFYHPSSRNAPAAAYCLLERVVGGAAFKALNE